MQPLPANLPELTSIRAIAALIVVLFHMFFSEKNTPSPIQNLISDGHLGVDLFFLLSGFILTHVYLKRWRQGTFEYKSFLVNRFARIYPLHLTIMLLFLAAYSLASLLNIDSDMEGQNWEQFKWHLTLLHAWGTTDGHSWNFPSWSVSAELFAYISFPVVLFISQQLPPRLNLIACVVLLFLGTFFSQALLNKPITKLMFDFGILRVAVEFLLGVAIYLVMQKNRLPDITVRPIIYICIAFIASFSVLQVHETIIVIFIAILLAALAHLSTQNSHNILRTRFLIYLGEISYSTYMIHIMMLMTVPVISSRLGITSPILVNLITILAIYTASAALYHLVELPMRKIIRDQYQRVSATQLNQ